MPNYKSHLIGGSVFYAVILVIITYLGFAFIFESFNFVAAFAAILLGSLFPDIDTFSKGQRLFLLLLLPLFIAAIFFKDVVFLTILFVAAIFPIFAKHRGITHNPWFTVFISALALVATNFYFPIYLQQIKIIDLFFVLGVFSHLILDFGPILFVRKILFLK
ncbi:TPA: hypothetical protein DEO28_01470 [Candidatus Dependentiae bacterium]|nr:MAG: hypothetical protein UR14_C0003G0141 [candidate division TM6 bacterium GW2011_GWE2_31_21]KKP53695.1 MAG: hypothetical protein UR43_C0003G0016 [candidate division TM6 bacterium GW2011_GWF2_33_332]HBS48553.1 hypothetical protein [Candidatus Dependentiae bacterium]HBZ73168.1 hypothetical protein [Candidatus Dependentiae bacterium]